MKAGGRVPAINGQVWFRLVSQGSAGAGAGEGGRKSEWRCLRYILF